MKKVGAIKKGDVVKGRGGYHVAQGTATDVILQEDGLWVAIDTLAPMLTPAWQLLKLVDGKWRRPVVKCETCSHCGDPRPCGRLTCHVIESRKKP